MPDDTRTGYAHTLTALAAAIRIHRRSEGALVPVTPGDENGTTVSGTTGGAVTTTGAGSRKGTAASCGCGRRIRVTASVLALGPITCGVCGQPFTAPAPTTPTADADGADETDADADGAAETGTDETSGVDEAGSVSRQHYIDTGHYLDTDGLCPCDEEGSG